MVAIEHSFVILLDLKVLQWEPEPAICKTCGTTAVYSREGYLWVEGCIAFYFDELPRWRCAKGHEWPEPDVLEAALKAIRAEVRENDLEERLHVRFSYRSPF